MKQFLRHIFLLLALFMATANAWAQCYVFESPSGKEYNFTVASGTNNSDVFELSGEGNILEYYYHLVALFNASNDHVITPQWSNSKNGPWTSLPSISTKSKDYPKTPATVTIPRSAKFIRFQGSSKGGTKLVQVKNIKVSRAIYADQPSVTTLNLGEAMIGSDDTSNSTTMAWSNTSEFNWSIAEGEADKFYATITDNASTCNYGTAKITAYYKHNIVGSHNAVLVISNGTYTHSINLSGTTLDKYDAVFDWTIANVDNSTQGEYHVGDYATITDAYTLKNKTTDNAISLPVNFTIKTHSRSSIYQEDGDGNYDNDVLSIESGVLKAKNAGVATITASFAGNSEYKPFTKELTLTIKKHDLKAFIVQSTAVWNEIINNPFYLTDGLLDFTVGKSSDENVAKYDASTKNIQTYYTDGVASFQITRPEDYKYNALNQELKLTVAASDEACPINLSATSAETGTGDNSTSGTITLNGAGDVLSFNYKLNNNANVAHYLTTQYSTSDDGDDFQDIANSGVGEQDQTELSHSFTLPQGTKRIRFKRTDNGWGDKYFIISNITVTRKTFLTPQIEGETFYLTQSSVGMNFFGAFQLDWSTCADEIQLSCDNDLFTISTSATEEITTIDASAGEGSTMVYISYTTTEEDPDLTGTLTIYDHGQSKAITLSCEHMAQIIEWPEYFHRLEATENGYIDTLISLTAWAKTVKGLPTNQPITYTVSVDTTEHASLINQDGSTYLHITGICTGIITASVEGFVSGNGITYSAASLTRPIRIRKAGDPCDPYALNIFDEVAFNGWIEDILIYELRGDLHESQMDFYAHVAERSIYNTLIIDFSTDGTTWTNRQTFENIPEAYDWTKHPQFQCTVPDDAKYVRFETKSSLNTYINMVTIRQQEYFNASVETIIINDAVVNELFTSSFQLDYSNVPFVQYSVTNHNGLNLQLLPSPEINNDCGDAGSYTFTLKGTSPYPQTNVKDTITLFTSAKHEIKIPVTITSTLTENIYYFVTAGDWSNLNNWRVNNVVPTQLPTSADPVVVQAATTISAHAHAYGISVQNGGSIHITPTGGLTIYAGGYASENQDEDLEISIDNNAAGYFRMSPDATTPMPRAKVNFTTRGNMNNGGNKDAAWQYIGAPGRDVGMDLLGTTVLYLRSEEKGWVRLRTFWAELQEFAGYALSQKEQPSFTLYPQLLKDNVTIPLTYTENGMQGDNLWANSYMAPLDITKFTEDDFTGNITRTFYLYNSGSWNNWNDQQSSSVTIDAADKTPGRYYAIAALSAANLGTETQTVIPPMQGVYMVAGEGGGSIKLNYEKHVWNNIQTDEMNRPLRVAPISSHQPDIMRIRLQVNSLNSGADRMYIIQDSLTTSGYDNGYDAPKLMAEGLMNIYTNEPFGKMEISSTNDMDSMYIGFQAGEDTTYTMTFTSLLGDSLYLYDTEQAILLEMTEGGQYHFSAIPQSTNDFRFQLLVASESSEDNPEQGGDITTDVEAITPAKLWISDRQVYITNAKPNNSIAVYTISGMQIAAYTIHSAPCTIDLSYLPTGIYVLRLNDQAYKFICK